MSIDDLHDNYSRQLWDELDEQELRVVMCILEKEHDDRGIPHDSPYRSPTSLEFAALTGYLPDDDDASYVHGALYVWSQDAAALRGAIPIHFLLSWWSTLRRHQMLISQGRDDICTSSCPSMAERFGQCTCDLALPRIVQKICGDCDGGDSAGTDGRGDHPAMKKEE